jgi:hypothetical protein
MANLQGGPKARALEIGHLRHKAVRQISLDF